jgi:hypothetical protein
MGEETQSSSGEYAAWLSARNKKVWESRKRNAQLKLDQFSCAASTVVADANRVAENADAARPGPAVLSNPNGCRLQQKNRVLEL